MDRLLKIDDYIEVHMSKKAFIYCPTLSVEGKVTAMMDMTLYTRFILEME